MKILAQVAPGDYAILLRYQAKLWSIKARDGNVTKHFASKVLDTSHNVRGITVLTERSFSEMFQLIASNSFSI